MEFWKPLNYQNVLSKCDTNKQVSVICFGACFLTTGYVSCHVSRSPNFCSAERHTYQVSVVRKVDNAIRWIAWFVLSTLIRWIAIYPVDSVIQPLNNRGQAFIPTILVVHRT